MKRFKLSNSEEILMDTLWRENRPLTTLQLTEKVTEASWNTNYIDKLLGQLVKKGMVQVSGLLQNGRYQSRQFVPCYTKDEFLANMLEEQGVNQALFARIAVARFKKPAKSNESEQEEKLIAERLGVDAYSLLEEMASRVPAGSHGVMPIFSDAMHFKQWYHAAPSFINLSIDPEKCNKATLFRALEENAAIVSACNLAQISQFSGVTFDSLVFAGGGSKGALWSQILSDVTGLPVRVPVVREATALGCAIAAGAGAGLYGDMASAGEKLVRWHREFSPNPQHRELYQEMMSKWQSVYADQLGLGDSGLTTSMWQAPGLERRQRVASSPSP